MTDQADRAQGSALRLAEAAAWRVRLHEADLASTAAFEAWLAEDPANAAAWQQVQAPWNVLGEQAAGPVLIEARRDALNRARVARRRNWRGHAGNRASLLRVAGAAAAMVALAVGIGVWYGTEAGVYRTAMGERRVVTLEDGSRISLDSRSRVRVRYSADARDVTLLSGQARFDVARDVERPFSVFARDRKVVATGTSFNVDLLGAAMLVTLIEGSVVVLDQPAPPTVLSRRAVQAAGPAMLRTATELGAGEQLVIAPMRPAEIRRVDVDKTTAWEQGRLVFENEPLGSVVVRVSRYTQHGIRVADPRVAEMRISGVFNAGDMTSFVATITSYLPVNADGRPDGSVELHVR